MSHVGGAISLELGIANKNNNGMNVIRSKRKERLYGFSVLVVLPQRIHEAILFLEHNLGPLPCLGVPENPSGVVLGLNHKYAVSGNDNVVDLR